MEQLSEAMGLVRQLLAIYCESELGKTRDFFKVEGPYSSMEIREALGADRAGCYVVYGVDKSIKYIGMTEHKIANRVLSHFSKRVQLSPFWSSGSPANLIDIIPVREKWQPYSLEIYLTKKIEDLRFRGSL